MICNIANYFIKSFIRTHSRSQEFYHLNLISVEAELLVVSGCCRGSAPLLPNSEVFCPSQYSQFFLLMADGLCWYHVCAPLLYRSWRLVVMGTHLAGKIQSVTLQ